MDLKIYLPAWLNGKVLRVNSLRSIAKNLFVLLPLMAAVTAIAQPTVLGTQTANGSYVTYDLTNRGGARFVRIQATSGAASGARNWEFATGTAASTNYSTNWRPYTSGQTLSAYNTYIDPSTATASARYNTGSGGQSGLMPAVTSGNYYTFNVGGNATANNFMSVLETTYNPTSFSSAVQVPTAANVQPGQTVALTVNMAASLNTGEFVYVRYSTDGFATSTVATVSFTGSTGTVNIPNTVNTSGTTVAYYFFSSNQSSAPVAAQSDYFTLNLFNSSGQNVSGGGTNFSYTVATASTIYLHNFNDTPAASPYTTSPTATTGTPTGVFNANLSSSSWALSSTVGGFAGNSGTALCMQSIPTSAQTMTLTFSVASGYQVSISSFNFWRVRSSTNGLNIGSMTINGTTVYAGSTTPTTGAFIGTTNVSTPIANLTGTITIVINFPAPAASSSTFRLDEFQLNGTVSLIPTTPPIVTGFTVAAPGSGTSGYVGNTITVNGSGFTGTTIVRVGGSGGTAPSSFTVVSDNQITFPAPAAGGVIYVQNSAGNSSSSASYTNLGYITTTTGAWSTAGTWLGGAVPPSANTTDVTIAHNVTSTTANVTVRNLTVNTGITLTNSAGFTLDINGASTNSGTITNNGTISVTGVTYTNSGTFTVGNGGTFQINQGGFFAGTAISYNATASTLLFNNTTGQYGVANTHVYWPATNGPVTVTVQGAGGVQLQTGTTRTVTNLTLNAGFDIQAANLLTVNGTLQINTGGGITTNPPIYGNASTLVYNTTSNPYGVATEWTGNATTAGAGVPQNVTIQSSNNVSMPNSNRGLAGNLLITGTATLTLNATSGDIYVAGNFTNNSNFNNNGRAVFMNGSAAQTISGTGLNTGTGTNNNFSYLVINNSTGGVSLNSAAQIVATAGAPLQLLGAGTFNINNVTLTMPGNGGNIQVTGGTRVINFVTTTSILAITGTKTVTSTTGGLLSFTSTVSGGSVRLSAGVDFGAGLTTIGNNTFLIILTGGFVNTNPVTYATGSTLSFRTGATYTVGTTDRTWGPGTSGAGVPFTVEVNAASTIVDVTDDRTVTNNVVITLGTLQNNAAGKTITVASAVTTAQSAVNLNNAAAVLTIGGGNLTIGPSGGGNQTLNLGLGAMTLSSGTVTVNGNVARPTGGATLTQSGGLMVIDGNSGTAGTSVGTGVPMFGFVSGAATGMALSAGTIRIVDPHHSSLATANQLSVSISYSTAPTAYQISGTHTFEFGDGVSTTVGNTDGFVIDTYVGTIRIPLQNVTVNAGNGTGRWVSSTYSSANGTHINGTLTINSGSQFRNTLSTAQFALGGNIVNNGTFTSTQTVTLANTPFAGGALVAATAAQSITGTGAFQNLTASPTASFTNLTINNSTAGVAVSFAVGNLSISGALTLTSGIVSFGSANNFTFNSGATVSRTSGWIVADGTGQVMRTWTTTGSFAFPIGDNTGTAEYSPITLNLTTNATTRTIGVRVTDAAHPQVSNPLAATNYLSRYWSLTDNQTTNVAGIATMTYITGADPTGDVNGTEGSIKAATYAGGAWNQVTGSIGASTLTSGTITASTGLNNYDVTGRDNPGIPYTWVGTTDASWSTATNWSPNGVPGAQDQVTISSPGTNTLSLTTAVSVTNFIVSGTGDFTIASTGSLTVTGTVTSTTSATPTLNCASTFTMSSATAQTIPAWNYGNLNAAGGNRTWVNGSTTSICGNFTPGAGTYTTTGSTVNFNGTTAQSILTNASNFATLNITNTTSTVTAALGCTVGTALTINTGATFIQSTGALTVSNATVTVNGTLRNSSTSDIVQTGATVNVNGTYDHNRNAGVIPTATWGASSNMLISGSVGSLPSGGLGQSFNDVTITCASLSASNNFSGALTNIGRDLIVTNTNGFTIGLTASTPYAGTIGRNLNISGGFITGVTGTVTGNVTLNVNGSLGLSGTGGFSMAGGSSTGTGTTALTVVGSLTNSSSSGTSFVLNGGARTVTGGIGAGFSQSGTGTVSIAQGSGAGTLTIAAGGLSISNGTLNFVSGTGTGTINLTVGSFTQSGGTVNMVSASTGASALNLNSASNSMDLSGGTFNALGTGAGSVPTANRPIITLAGNFSQSGSHAFEFAAGTVTSSANPSGELRVAGNMTRAGSSYIRNTSPSVNNNALIVFNGTTQNYDATGLTGNFNYTNVQINSGSTVTLLSDMTLSGNPQTVTVLSGGRLNCGTWTVVSPAAVGTTFALNAGGTLSMGSPFGITTSTTGASGGNIQTNTRTFTAGCNLIYAGSANQVTGNAQPASVANLTIANTGGSGNNVVTLTNAATVTGTLTLTSGLLQLGANDLTVSGTTAGAISGGSSTAFVQTNSTGRLIRGIANAGLPLTYNFPVGTSTDYTPASYTFSANATAFSLGARAVAGTHPQMNSNSTQVDYLANRYWATSTVGSPTTYTYTSSYTFISGDAQGTTANIFLNRWGGSLWTQDAGSSVSGSVLSSGSLTETTANLSATAEWTGRDNPAAITYTWNGSLDNSWNTAANWTPNGVPGAVDNIIVSSPGTNGLILSGTLSINNVTVSSTGTFTSDNTAAFTINGTVTYTSSAAVNLDCASTVFFSLSTPQTIPAWGFGNLNATGGNRILSSTGTIGICGTFTPGAGTYTIAGSTINFNGTGNQTVNLFNYHNLTIGGARTAATVTLPSGTIGVAGNFSVTATGTSYTTTGNTVDFNGTGAQTIGAFGSFNNLTVSGNKGTNTVTFGAGTVGIGGTFSITATNASYSTTGNTIDFTSTGAQTIVSFTGFRYNNLSNSGNGARTLTNTPTIVIDGVYTPTTGAVTIGTSTIDFGSASSQPIPATNYYNITNTGNGARVWASSGIIDINNGFSPSTGVNTITGSTVRYSSTVAGPFTMTSINTNVAGASYNNLTIAGSSATPTVFQVGNGVTIGVAGNLTMTSGTLRLATTSISGTVNVLGNLVMNAGIISLSNSGNLADAGVLNLYGDVSFTGGTVSRATSVANGTVNFVKSTGVQLLSYSATSFTISSGFGIPFNVGNGTTTNTVQFTTNFTSGSFTMNVLNNASVDFGTFVLSGSGSFSAASGGTVITANTAGLASSGATGSVQTTARTFNTGVNYVYNGTLAQITGTALTASNNLTINNTAGVTLTSATTVAGTLSLTNGTLSLGANNLTITNTAASAITGASASNFVLTGSTGSLVRAIPASIASSATYNFPIGLSAGNYSPASFTFTSTTNAFNLTTRVLTGTHPQINSTGTQTDFMANRYFTTSTSGTPGAYAYTSAFTFVSGDAQGTAANIKLNRWNGASWSEDAGSSTSGNTVTSGSLTDVTGSLAATAEWTGRVNPTPFTYTWTGTVDGSWTNPANWSPGTSVAGPTLIDDVIISSVGANMLSLTTTQTVLNFTVSGTGDFTIASTGSLTITGNVTSSTSATPTMDCASTVSFTNTGSVTIPAWNFGNLSATGGNRTLSSTGTISICGTFTRGAGTYTVTGSTVNYNGTGAQTIALGTYNNLTISNNRGGATLTLPAGTIDIAGTFNPTVSNYVQATTGNTINFSGAAGQGIPAFTYGAITSADFARTWANSGIIDINEGFAPPATAVNTITGSTIRYSNTSATTWNLTNFTTNIAGRQYNNLEFVGGASTAWRPATASPFSLGVNGNLTISGAGTLTLNAATALFSPIVGGNLSITGAGGLILSNATGNTTFTVTGNTSVSAGSITLIGALAGAGVTATMSTTDLTVSGTGAVILDAASNTANAQLTINGNTNVTSTAANALNLGSGTANANNQFNFKGNVTKSGTGNFGTSGTYAATALFNFNGTATQQLNYTGAGINSGSITIAAGATVQLMNNFTTATSANSNPFTIAGTLDADVYTLTPGNSANTFALSATGTLITTQAGGVSAAISGWTSGNTSWAAGASYTFDGNNQSTGFAGYTTINSGSAYNITWLGSGNLTLDKAVTLTTLNFTNSGLIILGANNITMQSAGSITGTGFGATKMIVADGAGSLIRSVSSAGAGIPFTWPIGDNTGTAEYSPVTINNVTTSIAGTIGFRVVDAVDPNMGTATNYISRYWPYTLTGLTTHTWSNATFTYAAADIVGTESLMKANAWNSTNAAWTQFASSSSASNVLTWTSGANQATLLNGDNITAREDKPNYYRSKASSDWTTLSTWEVSTDPAFVSPAPVPATVIPNAANAAGIQISSGNTVGITTTVTADDITIVSGGILSITANGLTVANGAATNDLIIASGGTLQYSSSTNNSLTISTGAAVQVNGLLKNNGAAGSPDVTNNGTITVTSTGTYEHARNAGIIPTCTWNSGSTCLLTGTTNNTPTGLGQTFHHFTVNCTLTASVNTSGALQTINGKFKLTTNHATNWFALGSGTAFTLTVGDSLIVNNGILNITNGAGVAALVANGPVLVTGASSKLTKENATTATWTFNNNFTMNAGTFEMNAAGSSNTTVNFLGNVTFASGTSWLRTNGGTHIVNFIRASGQQDFSFNGTQGAGAIAFNIGNGTTTNTVRITSPTWTLSTSAHAITVNNLATLDMQAAVISGSTTAFTAQTGSTLRIGHPQGITSGTTAQGNVQTNGTRTFNNDVFYVYNGTVNQVTGNGLPATPRQLTIANTGTSGNNVVTLSQNVGNLNNSTPAYFLVLQSGLLNLNTFNVSVNNVGVQSTGGDFVTSGVTGAVVGNGGTVVMNGTINFPNVTMVSSQIDFGSSSTIWGNFTVSGSNILPAGSAPTYASGSTLIYNVGYGTYKEWTAGTSGVGVPWNVQVNSTFTLDMSANTGNRVARGNFIINGTVNLTNGANQAGTTTVNGNLNVNSGGTMSMGSCPNALTVGGNMTNAGTLSLSTALGGDIYVGGNWNSTGTLNFNSRAVFFNGSGAQTIQTAHTFPFVVVTNGTGGSVSLGAATTISSGLTLTQGRLILNSFNLTTDLSATITGGSATSYVQTNGTGRLIRTVGTSNVAFPVGNSAYNPIILNNAGTTDTYGVLAVDGTAPAINNAARAVQRYWDVTETNAGGSNLTVTTQWNAPVAQAGEEGANFLRNDASRVIGNYPTGGPWNEGTATLSGSNPYTYSASGFTNVGIFEPGMGDAFRAKPYVTNVSSLSAYTGDVIQFTGDNLGTVNSITFGGVAATINTGTQTSTFVEATVNAGAAGSINVTNPNGTWTTTGFTYLGYITDNAGDWNTPASWRGGNVPPAGVATTINNSNTVNAAVVNAPLSVTVNAGQTLSFGAAGALNATNVTVGSSALLTLGAGGTLTIANGGVVTNNGNLNGGTAGTLVFAGSGTLAGGTVITLRNFTINGGATLTNAPQILGTFQINAGGFVTAAPTYGASSTLRYNTGGTYGRNFEWSATSGAGYPANVQLSNNTTLNLSNGGAATARAISGSLTVDAGSTLSTNTMSAPLTIAGAATLDGTLSLGNATAGVIIGTNLSINATGALTLSTAGGGDITVGGNWTRATGGTFTANSRAVFFNGTGTQNVTGPAGGNVFPFLLLNKTAGTVVMNNDVTVSGVLTFMSSNVGTINANGFNLIVSSTSTTAIDRTGSGYVIGNLQRGIAAGTNTYSFPVGSGSVYAPASMAISGAATPATMTVSTTGTDHPNLSTSGINASLSVNRFWSVAVSGLSATNVQPTFNWVSGDVDGGANFNNFLVQRRQVGAWFTTTAGTITATSAQVTGITSFGDFAVGECKTPNDYSVTGGGSYCAGGSGVVVGLSGSDSWVTYQLRVNGVNTGSPVTGTGSAISFGNQTSAGSYTVIATNVGTSCTAQMSGNATVTITSPATPTVAITTTSTTICAGQSLTFTATPNNGGGTPTYQWKKNGTNVGTGGTTYTDNALVNGDVITVVMTTSLTCVTATTATSNALTITVGTPVNYYVDADGDGYGSNTASPVSACSAPAGYVTNNTDCDDANADRNPGADEYCSPVDEDCDGLNNEGLPVNIYYQDADGDGRGNPAVQQIYCEAPAGYVANANDCNDACAVCWAGAIEVADGFDNDCDGLTDEGFGPANDEKINALVAVQSGYGLTCTTVTGTLLGATPSPEATTGTTVTGEDVWYYFTAVDTAYSIQVSTSNYNLRIELHADVTGSPATTIRDSENWSSSVGNETLNYFGTISGQRYFICVRNFNSAQTINPATATFQLCVRPLQRGGFNYGSTSYICGDPLPCYGPYTVTYNHCDVVNARFTRANQYRFEFKDVITNVTYNGLTATGTTFLQLSQVPGLIPGRTYNVNVYSIYSTTHGDGSADVIEVPPMYRPYIAPTSTSPAYARQDFRATITLNPHTSMQLRTIDACPTNRLLNSWVACTPAICGATNYEWRFTRVLPSAALPITVTQATQYSAWMQLGSVPGLTAGTYDVEIRPVYPGGFKGAWSTTPSCLKIVGSLMNNYDRGDELLHLEEKVTMEEMDAPVRANVFPNPTTGEVTQLLVTGYTGSVQVNIYDAAGALVYSQNHSVADGDAVQLDLRRELGQGLYNVVIMAGDHQIKRKLMVMK